MSGLTRRRGKIVAAGLILVVAAVAIVLPQLHRSTVSSVSVKNSGGVSKQTADQPTPLPTADTGAQTNTGADESTASGNNGVTSPTSVLPLGISGGISSADTLSSTAVNAVNCPDVIKQQTNSYNKVVDQQKTLLDNALTFMVGSIISSNYVKDYNQSVQSSFDKTAAATKTAGCIFPIDKPALLPSSYPY